VLPQPVRVDLTETLREYWLKRAAQHTGDSYAGPDWLGSPAGAVFRVRRELELYGISCHPEGFLQRLRARLALVRAGLPTVV
jgi:hypothetical protein